MAKRPTPKKRREKSRGRAQHSAYVKGEMRRLTNRLNSPFAPVAEQKNREKKALKGVTRVKA